MITSKSVPSPDLHERAERVRFLFLDVDGVLTDGKLYFAEDGSEMKAFNTLDGQGIKMLIRMGIRVGIITGRTSRLVAKRAEDLGVSPLIQGREDKLTALREWLVENNAALENIAFMGDDLPDLTVMRHCTLALTVPNAHSEVKANAHWQSEARGGEGAVREACDFLLRSRGLLDEALKPYLHTS